MDEQAGAFARTTSELATKTDVEALRAAVKADRAADLAETKAVIRKWMLATIVLQSVVILGVLVALVRASDGAGGGGGSLQRLARRSRPYRFRRACPDRVVNGRFTTSRRAFAAANLVGGGGPLCTIR